jgi:hypothetical protein
MSISKTLKSIAILTAALASSYSFAQTMSSAEHSAAKTGIKADYKIDKAACSSSTANAKDICNAQAKGKEKLALAELEFKRTNTYSNGNKVAVAKADGIYAVAKEVCDDKTGEAKTLCRTEAKSAHTKSIAESKMDKKIGEAKVDEKQDINKADYKVAVEKCEVLGSDAKTACIANAKTKYKQN